MYTPTLTGLGEREHLARPETDLDTHITDVVNVLEYEELRNVVLVGHSYAGLVVSGVTERTPERIGHVVYLDAMVPMGEQPTSAFDMGGPEYREMVETKADASGEGWRWPLPDEPDGWVGLSEEDTRWMRSKAVPQPVGTLSKPLERTGANASDLPSTYVLCTENGMQESVLEIVRDLTATRGWERHEFETGHWPMVSMPAEVITVLEEAAATGS